MKRRSELRAVTQRGFVLFVAVVRIVIAALIPSAMVFLSAPGTDSGDKHLQPGQGLFVAESGLEYEQRQLAQNVDWSSISAPSHPAPAAYSAVTR